MHFVRLDLLPHMGKEHLGFLSRPTPIAHKQSQRVAIDGALEELRTEEPSDLFQSFVLGPRPDGADFLGGLDVFELRVC